MDIVNPKLTNSPLQPCELCQWNGAEFGGVPSVYILSLRYNELKASSKAECIACALFKKAFDIGIPNLNVPFGALSASVSNGLDIKILGPPKEANMETQEFDVFMLPDAICLPKIRRAQFIPPRTDLDLNLANIQRWIQGCEESHAKCREQSDYLPMRMLDVMTGKDIIRLVESDSLPTHPPGHTGLRYACLSHCWGQSRSRHLTKRGNLQRNLSGVPVAELPKTFRDAILVSRALGIHYLWIDSLCIVQDDMGDWETHLEAMAHIYRNAYITLAAGASVDDEGGLFRTVQKAYSDPEYVSGTAHGEEFKIYMRPRIVHPDQLWGKIPPLMARGWVFQEMLLSRRFLCFANEEVQWICLEDVACACSRGTGIFNPRDHGVSDGLDLSCFPGCRPIKSSYGRLKELNDRDKYWLWRQLVQQYSKRKLTYPSDKLPALAGLVNVFREALADEYVEGLWMNELPRDLLWERRESSAGSRGRLRPKAPSWSWVAAADGPIYWRQESFHTDGFRATSSPASLLKTKDELWKINYVRNNVLSLSGYVTPAWLEKIDLGKESIFDNWECYLRRRHHKLSYGETSRDASISMPIAPNHIISHADIFSDQIGPGSEATPNVEFHEGGPYHAEFFADYKFWENEDDLENILSEILLFETGSTNSYPFDKRHRRNESSGGVWTIAGLILRRNPRTVSGIQNTYERIGAVYYHPESLPSEWKSLGTFETILVA
jgi:hypothetical protein